MRIKCGQCDVRVSKNSIKVFKGPSSLVTALCPSCANELRKDKQADPFYVKGMKRHRLEVLCNIVDQLLSEKASRKQYGLSMQKSDIWKNDSSLFSSPIAVGFFESLKNKGIAELREILIRTEVLLGPCAKSKLLRNRYMLEVGSGASNQPNMSPEGYVIQPLLMVNTKRTKGEIERDKQIKKQNEKIDNAKRRAQALHEKRRKKVKDWKKPGDEGTADRNTITLAKGRE